MDMPNISIGANCAWVSFPGVGEFWFSYRTLIAFQKKGCKQVVRENDWGPTTGKHLNAIDHGPKSERLPAAAFEAAYHQTFGK